MKLLIKTIIISVVLASSSMLMAGTSTAELAIFPVYSGNAMGDSMLKAAYDRISGACAASGRFVPAEYNSLQEIFRSASGKDRSEFYRNAAAGLGVDAYIVLTIYSDGGGYRLVVEFFPLADHLEGREFKYSVFSAEPENIPLKAAREFALFLKKFPVYAVVRDAAGDGTFTINAGQWHGIRPGKYSTDHGPLEVFDVSRYTSRCRGLSAADGKVIVINEFPDNDLYIKMTSSIILENTVRRFGTDPVLEKRHGSVQELVIATCLINQGASFCAPGYGSFLAVDYLGIEDAVPDKAVVGVTMLLTAGHFLIPSAMTEFEINFFPWIRDNDKSAEMQRLQWFLWCTVPVTFTVSYYSQLAHQYREKGLLPPVFMHYDTTWVVLSLGVPGCALFYKRQNKAGLFMN